MTISFNNIPTSLRIPFLFAEFDNSKAGQGPSIMPWSVLLLGQKLAAGSEAELGLRTITSEAEAITRYGQGSMIHRMAKFYFENNKLTELKVMAIDDAAAGVQATGKIAIDAGAATADGILSCYLGGQLVRVSVAVGEDQDAVAAALVAAITADGDLPVTAAVNGVNSNECDITFKHKGEVGSEMDIRFNYQSSEDYPAGIATTVTAMAGGAGNPDVAEIVAALPEEQFSLFINPWTDAANLTLLENELADRDGPTRQIDGRFISYKMDTLSNLQVLGNSRNSRYGSITGPAKSAPDMPYEWAAAKAGQVSASAQVDPAVPFQTLPLVGVKPPADSEQFLLAERNILLSDGIATDKVAAGGVVRIERVISTYQTNAAGAADVSYLDFNTGMTLSYLRYDFRTQMISKFPRHKLADDGTQFAEGQKIMTPLLGKAEAVRIYGDWEFNGLVEGVEAFKEALIVERNISDANRLDFLLSPDLINQLRVMGTQFQFLL